MERTVWYTGANPGVLITPSVNEGNKKKKKENPWKQNASKAIGIIMPLPVADTYGVCGFLKHREILFC